MHKVDYTALQHPRYAGIHTAPGQPDEPPSFVWFVNIGDEVAPTDPAEPGSAIVVAIYLDGMVELSTGDQVAAADLVLLRRAQ